MVLFPESFPITSFSESYEEARDKFLGAARAIDAECHSVKVMQDSSGEYMMDMAVVRGTGPGLVVVSSGTHGVEGYAGSAVQISILRSLAEKPQRLGPTVVMVHAVNPYGMAHFRRWNENNVDLNRNALWPHHFDRLFREDRLQETYDKFKSLMNPAGTPGSLYLHVGSWIVLLWNIVRYGMKPLKTALVAATYSNAEGVFFGGRELQSSHVVLRDFMTKHFSNVRARDVGWIDVHTGLGPSGVDVLMGSEPDRSELEQLFPAIPKKFDGVQAVSSRDSDEIIQKRCESKPKVERTSDSQSGGYEFTVGMLGRDEWVRQFFKPDSGRTLIVTQEFGTKPPISVARALIFENAGFHYDRKNHAYWASLTRDAFYVRTPAWKERVLNRGASVFAKFVAQVDARSAQRSSL